jgi:hypothetical protein
VKPRLLGVRLRPGERRFRDLLARERQDVAMLARNLAVIYDSITFGRVSKPNTKPEVVIALYEERLNEAVAEALAEAAGGLDVERLLDLAMTVRRMVEDGHPDDLDWFRIMAEAIHKVDDLTDAELMRPLAAIEEKQ